MKKILYLIFIFCIIYFDNDAYAQVSMMDSIPLTQVIKQVELKYGIKIFYKPEWLVNYKSHLPSKLTDAEHDLNYLLKDTQLSYASYMDRYFILYKGSKSTLPDSVNKTFSLTRSNILYTIEGRVLDNKNESPVIGATVYIKDLDKGTVTDLGGFFRFILPDGTYSLQIRSVGYIDQEETVNVDANKTVTLHLPAAIHLLNEVVISGHTSENINEITMGISRLDLQAIKDQPSLLGETDIIKSLLMLQGVTTVGEAASGFNVRGGSADQNLVIMDKAPLFNSSHIFGLFSTFNEDVVDDVTLMRSGIPPRYGGRLSSVLDVGTKNGQVNRLSGQGGVSLFASRLTLEIPLIKNKLTILTGGRILYSDFLLRLIHNKNINESDAFFYDDNIKINYRIRNGSQLFYSFYSSYDQFKLPTDTLYYWGSMNQSLTFNQLIGKKITVNATGVWSIYKYGMSENVPSLAFNWDAGIDYRECKLDFYYYPNKRNRIEFGAGMGWYRFIQGNFIPGPDNPVLPVKIGDLFSRENNLYASDEIDILPFLRMMAGVRFSQFGQVGPAAIHLYREDIPRSPENMIGTAMFSKGQPISKNHGWEPRVAFRFLLNNLNSIKVSYTRQYQYIQQLSNTTAITPIDLWFPSGTYLRPQIGDQISLGYFRNFQLDAYETSLEVYYKKSDNVIDYKNGAELYINPAVEAEILQGIGKAYGIEFYGKKNLGRLTGMVSYTYARTLKKILGNTEEETINKGTWYPATYDIPNQFNITATYKINRRWRISGNFIYDTGHPATFPLVKYQDDGIVIAQFSDRNMERIPDYHRLDLSITMKGNNKRHKFVDANWTFTLYNVYGRKNAYLVYFEPVPGTAVPQGFKYSFLGTIIPSLSYNFRFSRI